MSEVSESKTQDSYMQAFMENLLDWADSNDMQVNTTKTKEMTVGPLARSDLPILSTRVGTVNRVPSFKLEMWSNAQRDGRPAEYRWRPLFNATVWLCSNAAKMRNPLKFAGVPQTNEMISATSWPKFTIL